MERDFIIVEISFVNAFSTVNARKRAMMFMHITPLSKLSIHRRCSALFN